MADDSKEILLLIDSHALIHRAYHAFPDSLTTADGTVVNAVYGFARLLLEVLTKFDPKYVVATMDAPGPTIRHEQYGAYKANRSEPDDLLIQQLPIIDELLEAFDIPSLRIPGYEADDLIGTLDHLHSGKDKLTIIVTGDRDLLQLVDEDTQVYLAGSNFSKSKLYDEAAVTAKMEVKPEQIVDMKALQGDSSDNIPGVAGIGAKSAVGLLKEYGDLENIYKNLDKLEKRYFNKLQENYELAKTSQQLAQIITDVPIAFDFKEADFGTFDGKKLANFFQNYEFSSLNKKISDLIGKYAAENTEPALQLFPGEDQEEASFPEWGKQKLTAATVYLLADIDTQGDPLSWGIQNLYIQINDQKFKIPQQKLANFFTELDAQSIVTNQAKAIIHSAYNLGYHLPKKIKDVIIQAYLLNDGRVKQEWGSVKTAYRDSFMNTKDELDRLVAIANRQNEELAEQKNKSELIAMETNLMWGIVDMERNGIGLDQAKLSELQADLQTKVDKLEEEIYKDVGHEFNINSPKQVGEILFEEKGLPKGRKTKGGAYSTDERTLKELTNVDPIVQKILDHREYSKLLSTYVKPLPDHVNVKTKRIHAEFNQLGAITGRFSSQNPNLQNIPIREGAGSDMREAFTAGDGKTLIAIDYSQQELRLLAELSGEENLQKAFRESRDIHATAAADIFNKDLQDVTKEERRIGKTINFGVVYGISPYGLADRLKIEQSKAAEFIEAYYNKYPRVKTYYDELLTQAKEQGYVETLSGRRRSTEDLKSKNYHVRTAAEREIMNFPLQGGAADIIKLAMLKVMPVMEEFPARLVLQIHDELIFEYDISYTEIDSDKKVKDFVRKTKEVMLSVYQTQVPLEVEVEAGENWGNLKTLTYV